MRCDDDGIRVSLLGRHYESRTSLKVVTKTLNSYDNNNNNNKRLT